MRNNKTLLNDNSEISEWKFTWTKHTTADERMKVGLIGEQNGKQYDQEASTVKTWCNKYRKNEFLFKEKESIYDVFIEWCTK